MSKQTQGSMGVVGAIAGGIFLVAIVALMVVGDYTFSPALFLAAGVAVVVALFLLIAFHRSTPTELPAQKRPRSAVSQAQGASAEPRAASAAAPTAASEATIGTEPVRLHQPREGGPDDLKRIKGIGPKLEDSLHGMGVFHLDQIAAWSESEVAWMDENLVEFRGRVSRDDWVGQARQLTAGGSTSSDAEGGEVYH